MTAPTPTRGTFGTRLRSLRHQRGWTQAELAAAVGNRLQAKHISVYEQGYRVPAYRMLQRLAAALGVSLSELFEGVE